MYMIFYSRIKLILFCCIIGIATIAYTFFGSKSDDSFTQKQFVEAIMNYPMDAIVKRCQKDHAYSNEDMVILETELKRFLALSLIKDTRSGNGMYSSDVDNLWHAFILHTPDYMSFCDKYFGKYLHHVPESDEQKSEEDRKEAFEDFRRFIQNYERFFGEEIHPIWLLDSCEA